MRFADLRSKIANKIYPVSIIKEDAKTTCRYISVGETLENDIFIVGYPKSGNTWMTHLMCGIMYGTTMEYISNRLVRDLVPDVMAMKYYVRYSESVCFKSHLLPNPKYKKIIYVVRDGRDAIVSYYNMLKNRNVHVSLDDIVLCKNKEHVPMMWHEHVQEWLKNPYNAAMMVVKYEDLLSDPISELRKICNFVCRKYDINFLSMLSNNCSFESMRQKEESSLWDKAADWKENAFFIRKGKQGSYKEEMPLYLQDKFVELAGDTLRQLDYL